jgi:hypothetical protein
MSYQTLCNFQNICDRYGKQMRQGTNPAVTVTHRGRDGDWTWIKVGDLYMPLEGCDPCLDCPGCDGRKNLDLAKRVRALIDGVAKKEANQ